MLQGRRVLLGLSGGIAACKIPALISLLVKEGADVRVITTSNALEFTTALTLQTLSRHEVYSDMFVALPRMATEHIALSEWAEVFLIAPATANILGKLSHGIADDALSTTALAFDGPLFIAPAMNHRMWNHQAVQANVSILKGRGAQIIYPTDGVLACGAIGTGRMAEVDALKEALDRHFSNSKPLSNKRVLITAGPTHEAIDPVRYIANRSTGKMGISLALSFAQMGAEVDLICGPSSLQCAHPLIHRTDVVSALEMNQACIDRFSQVDIAVLSAAVADYSPAQIAKQKIKKSESELKLDLVPTPDILAGLGKLKTAQQFLVGFALETHNEREFAEKKLHSKNLDMIVMNSLKVPGAGFAVDTNQVSVICKDGKNYELPLDSKSHIAQAIVEIIISQMG